MVDDGRSFPEGSVVRDFRFGQFVLLSQDGPDGQSLPIVLTGESSKSLLADPDTTVVAKYGGVPLEWLYAYSNAVDAATGRAPHDEVGVMDIKSLINSTKVTVASGKAVSLILDSAAVLALTRGQRVTVWATSPNGAGVELRSVTIIPGVVAVGLSKEVLHSGMSGDHKLLVAKERLEEIAEGKEDVLVPLELAGGGVGLARLQPRTMVPLLRRVDAPDPDYGDEPATPTNPPKSDVPATGGVVAVATVMGTWIAGTMVGTLYVEESPGVDDSATSVPVQPRQGVRVAALLPWVQKWELTSHAKGSLVGTLALAPGEETTIRISSWVRSRKSLEQQTDLEVDQAMESQSTQRDSDEVLRELTSKHDFTWDIHGSLDATYNFGSGSISLATSGGVTSTDSIEQQLKSTQQHMREATARSSLRVASRRSTRITEERESFTGTDVVRTVRNSNAGRTLTLNYREVLAHYTVTTSFDSDRVQLVALVPNPLGSITWDPLTIRTFEHTLLVSLLEPSLADAFDAVRTLVAYDNAKTILAERRTDAKKVDDAVAKGDPPAHAKDNPHTGRVADYLMRLKTASGGYRGAAGIFGGFGAAVRDHNTPTNADVAAARRWVFTQALAAFGYGDLLHQLSQLTATAASVGEAEVLLAGVPEQPDGRKALSGLLSLSDKEVEDCGLHYAWTQQPGYVFWDDGYWHDNCKAYNVYSPQDEGIISLIDGLRVAWRDYQAKATELAAAADMAAVADTAGDSQSQASDADILEMKYGLEEVASAQERSEALMSHLRFNDAYYRYAVFQSLPPGVQLDYISQAAPQLRVGSFEPRVISMCGSYLCVPLIPSAPGTPLAATVTGLVQPLLGYATDAHPQELTLPTPGVAVEAWLGPENALEPEALALNHAAVRIREAEASIAESEAKRLRHRVTADNLDAAGGFGERPPASGS